MTNWCINLVGQALRANEINRLLLRRDDVRLQQIDGGVMAHCTGSPGSPEPPSKLCLPEGVNPSVWAASCINRVTRRCRQAEPVELHCYEKVFTTGKSQFDVSVHEDRLEQGVLVFKGGTRATPEAISAVMERILEAGYAATRARLVKPEEIKERGLIRRHYADHWQVAMHGQPTPEERLRFLDIYDRPQFKKNVGCKASACEVLAAYEFVTREKLSIDELTAWSEASTDENGLNSGGIPGPNELGDLTCVNLLKNVPFYQGPAVFLLNPHMLTIARWYEQAKSPVLVLLLEAASDNALDWKTMKREVCGGSDPATALPGSLRRDIWEGLVPLFYDEPGAAGRARNSLHLSNGPIEAVREAAIWFDIAPCDTRLGSYLIKDGGWSAEQLLESSHALLNGKRRIVVSLANEMSPAMAAATLARSYPVKENRQRKNLATLRRVDIAAEITRDLVSKPGTRIILASGSVAQNRCSDDSDIDLVLIQTNGTTRETDERIERLTMNGVAVEIERMSLREAQGRVADPTGDMRTLKLASRLALALVLYDPEKLFPALANKAHMLKPNQDELITLINDGLATLANQREQCLQGHTVHWDALRSLADSIAYIVLIFSPLRYQKPKWVLDDLRNLGETDILEALSICYGLTSSEAMASKSINDLGLLIDIVGQELKLVPFDVVMELGLVPEAPEYSYLCHCLGDAASLLGDGLFADADYTAKYSARMALKLMIGNNIEMSEAHDFRVCYQQLFQTESELREPDEDLFHRILNLLKRCADLVSG